jgi:hypothetical protein
MAIKTSMLVTARGMTIAGLQAAPVRRPPFRLTATREGMADLGFALHRDHQIATCPVEGLGF